MKQSNPLKFFNDSLEKRTKTVQKAQEGIIAEQSKTPFQGYLKQYPTANPSDTLAGSAPVFDGNIQRQALETAKKKTYGKNYAPSTNPKSYTTAKGYFDTEAYDEAKVAEKAARIPYKKSGGSVKSKKKK